jgi:hypothetical protein
MSVESAGGGQTHLYREQFNIVQNLETGSNSQSPAGSQIFPQRPSFRLYRRGT